MDRALHQTEQLIETTNESVQFEALSDIQLALIGGGIADTIPV